MRWGGRETVLTALAVNLLFLLSGEAAALAMPGEIDLQRLLIRSSYLVVLSLLFIVYAAGTHDDKGYMLQARVRGHFGLPRLIELIVEHVAGRLGSTNVIAVWRREKNSDRQGSAIPQVCCLGAAGSMSMKVPSDVLWQVLADSASQPFLFHAEKGRVLLAGRDKVTAARVSQHLAQFLERRSLATGIAVPIDSNNLHGIIFAEAEVSVDDLRTGTRLVEEAAFMLEQGLLNRLSEEAAAARTRLAIARDLHDSVAQLLAGLSFRLEALKRSEKAALELRDEVELLQQERATEQDYVRSLIAELREEDPPRGEVVPQIRRLTDRLAHQWSINCLFVDSGGVRPASLRTFGQEIEQMVREGVANAVRHGKADRVEIGLTGQLQSLELTIADNGCWLPENGDGATRVRPRSLEERAQALGGALEVASGECGTTIRIRLPLEASG